MATIRIQGVPLKPNKHVWISLTDIHGIGRTRAYRICDDANIEPSRRVSELSDQEVHTLSEACAKYKLEGDLRRETLSNIKRLRDIGCYRGDRHKRNLPCRGQRTRTNARTRKGPGKRAVVQK